MTTGNQGIPVTASDLAHPDRRILPTLRNRSRQELDSCRVYRPQTITDLDL
ncbi:hypothetical protein GMO_08370 [Gluconobacter morbifer G707]|uniref:Uncharacterized protein n=1 Tax=Gluconobacter morbifer G707 TaxID=1088869 RepID=G6XH72_9PROT|nr:hypothetical protein GMO_08370 [Gluconobacter morbifer G707]